MACLSGYQWSGRPLSISGYPPPEEQAAIVEQYRQGTTARHRLRHRSRPPPDRTSSSEYRTRLIADVVTGKLDVREAAARLPDEVEEPEPLDETDALTEGEEEPSDDLDAATEEAAV